MTNFDVERTPASGGDRADVAREHAGDFMDTARDRAGGVTTDARDAAGDVRDTVAQGASAVTQQAADQAADLLAQARGELTSQATAQTQRLGETLHHLGGDLRRMADGGDQRSLAAQIVAEAAHHVQRIGDHVQGREVTDLLDDVRGFARRRPGMFLLGAAGIGLVVGRLGRSVRDSQQSETAASGSVAEPYPTDSFPTRSITNAAPTTPGARTIEPPSTGPWTGRGAIDGA